MTYGSRMPMDRLCPGCTTWPYRWPSFKCTTSAASHRTAVCGFGESEGQTLGGSSPSTWLKTGRYRSIHCLYLGERMSKTQVYQYLGLMANSGAILITASDWKIRQILYTEKFPGHSHFYGEYPTSHKLSLKLYFCSESVWVSWTCETLQIHKSTLTQGCNIIKWC